MHEITLIAVADKRMASTTHEAGTLMVEFIVEKGFGLHVGQIDIVVKTPRIAQIVAHGMLDLIHNCRSGTYLEVCIDGESQEGEDF
jgi:hypothetical protein